SEFIEPFRTKESYDRKPNESERTPLVRGRSSVQSTPAAPCSQTFFAFLLGTTQQNTARTSKLIRAKSVHFVRGAFASLGACFLGTTTKRLLARSVWFMGAGPSAPKLNERRAGDDESTPSICHR